MRLLQLTVLFLALFMLQGSRDFFCYFQGHLVFSAVADYYNLGLADIAIIGKAKKFARKSKRKEKKREREKKNQTNKQRNFVLVWAGNMQTRVSNTPAKIEIPRLNRRGTIETNSE